MPPSQQLNLLPWADEVTHGLGGWWTCFQFDRAIVWFGRYVESRLSERHPDTHQPQWTLEELLDPSKRKGLKEFKHDFAGFVRKKRAS